MSSAYAATPAPVPSRYPGWYDEAVAKSNEQAYVNSELKRLIREKHLNGHIMLVLEDEIGGAEYEIRVVKEGHK